MKTHLQNDAFCNKDTEFLIQFLHPFKIKFCTFVLVVGN